MDTAQVTPVPYQSDSCAYFARLRGLPGAVFLDSARPHASAGRFDILAAEPVCVVSSRGARTETVGPQLRRESDGDPLDALQAAIGRYLPPRPVVAGEWPFPGGAIGYFGYELLHGRTHLPRRTAEAALPDMRVGIYRWALIQDHDRRRSALVSLPGLDEAERARLLALLGSAPVDNAAEFRLVSDFVSNLDPAAYAVAFERIQQYIRSGDCYQVNLAQRLSASCSGDPWLAYQRLRTLMGSPFSAYFDLDDAAVLSFSPERLIRVCDARVEARPIKGTIRRGSTASHDREQVERLVASEKDRAENVMIVDLLRNDLGKNCRTGSVRVEKLCALESYANVHHLVSVVTGQLREDRGPIELLRGCFPGGSITGAPKLRAMQIIDELEPDHRSVYCGSIGYISSHGVMDMNIAIRTVLCTGGRIHCWGGGGIVSDSDMETEYRESLTKVEPLLNALGRTHWISGAAPLTDRAGLRA